MSRKIEPGLGELLRYVSELVESGAEEHYQQMGLKYRARYTPVLRAIRSGAQTVTEITSRTHLTQGAISQTISQMETDAIVSRQRGEDGRQTVVQLTPAGKKLVTKLNTHWSATFEAIEHLEQEIGYPLRHVLENAAKALEQRGFAQRLTSIKQSLKAGSVSHA
ncbi:MarR family transcriptional regulator [Pseudomonas sp. PDM16]|uniref:MarR family winged helix-turn-helix transcriptional regulator n=1 Tax=Pseudomonas sp. PDM16 TaxID=2769292 RepID=UPI00177F21A7|nr:MarR family transcriptional regulator [Pseudomonas sp. PDM16]MBD9415326.1 MarR family transcriptional regulator [Pseudomonas sp. PDM16]